MREELIGYLLGALDAEEQARVEEELRGNEELQHELELLAESLEPLEADAGEYDPPVGLARKTCLYVERKKSAGPAPLSREMAKSSPSWSLLDITVAAGVCVAAALLFLPAIAQSRNQASLLFCENNLRTLGVGLSSYSDANRGWFPVIPPDGKLAAAGIYAPILHEQGFVTDAKKFFCSSVYACPSGGQDEQQVKLTTIPTRQQLTAAEGRELAELLKQMGGDYAYVLGYMEDGKLYPVRNQGRSQFAILADAPNLDGGNRTSLNHGGCKQNVLFEDGSVRTIIGCKLGCGDDLFLNDAGFPAAGTHADDSVLGHSSMPPVRMVLSTRE